MRLLNTQTLEVEYFLGGYELPPYAILSHTWGNDEATFQDFRDPDLDLRKSRRGYFKIQKTCDFARNANLRYCWIDTCCIDKTSSAELTEAINSMFGWYRGAAVCYAWLADLPAEAPIEDFGRCRWFYRGWTLQELIAPRYLEFYDMEWRFRGTKEDLSKEITEVTSISEQVLADPDSLFRLSVAQRMSWASKREATRVEDTAYCLLGIFDVNMPMLYGEGHRAFTRLQEEIAKEVNDLSLFAWKSQPTTQRFHGLFAPSPAAFSDSGAVSNLGDCIFNPEFSLMNKGLTIVNDLYADKNGSYLMPLKCSPSMTGGEHIGIWIQAHGGGVYGRTRADEFGFIPEDKTGKNTRLFLSKRITPARSADLEVSTSNAFMFRNNFNEIHQTHCPSFPFESIQQQPLNEWDSARKMFLAHRANNFIGFAYFMYRRDLGPSIEPDELNGGEAFIIAFGKMQAETTPWVVIATAREGLEMFQCFSDLPKMAVVGRRLGARTATLKDNYMRDLKKICVAIEEATVDGQKVYCIDLDFQALTAEEWAQRPQYPGM